MGLQLLGVGDLMLGRGISARLAEADELYPFAHVRDVLRGADVVVGNLETPLTDREASGYAGLFPRFAAPRQMAERIRDSGFDAVCLANNHIMDKGAAGLDDTVAALDAAGVRWFGMVPDEAAEQVPVVVEREGVALGLLGYSGLRGSRAARGTPGAAPAQRERMEREISRLRGRVDHVCVSLHAGYEWAPSPPLPLLRLFEFLLELGVDVVFGHHPHVPQGVLRGANGSIAFCSLGNFVADMHTPEVERSCRQRSESALLNPFCRSNYAAVRTGLLARVELEAGRVRDWSARPVRIRDDFAPELGRAGARPAPVRAATAWFTEVRYRAPRFRRAQTERLRAGLARRAPRLLSRLRAARAAGASDRG